MVAVISGGFKFYIKFYVTKWLTLSWQNHREVPVYSMDTTAGKKSDAMSVLSFSDSPKL